MPSFRIMAFKVGRGNASWVAAVLTNPAGLPQNTEDVFPLCIRCGAPAAAGLCEADQRRVEAEDHRYQEGTSRSDPAYEQQKEDAVTAQRGFA
jgi:hypothetical protein